MEEKTGWYAEGNSGAVTAGHQLAVAAGIELLQGGGNAADAAAATIFALNVTDHYECSIGGEVPILHYSASDMAVKALSGQGRAPLSQAAIDWYMEHGIPGEGDIKMAPVPSVVDSCVTLLQHFGTKSFCDVIAPALSLLDDGAEAWHPNLAVTLRKLMAQEQSAAGSREEKLQSACDRFYGRNGANSDIADSLEAFYIEKGGFLRKNDLARHATRIEEPVTVDYRGYTIYKCGTWTQGPYLCQALRLLEGFDLKGMGRLSPDYIHVAIEAIKLAMADRDEYYGDPDFVDVPLSALLSRDYAESRRTLIDLERASNEACPGNPYTMEPRLGSGKFRPGTGGTTTCVVSDRWGNVVAATPSANVHRPTVDGGSAGVTYGNRLRSLNTKPGHPNCIQPGKRPRSTLTPTLVLKDGGPVLGISVAGGDKQDQVTLKLLLDIIEFDVSPKEAVTTPRFATSHHQDSFDPDPDRERTFGHAGSLEINAEIGDETVRELAKRGHDVSPTESAIARPSVLYLDRESGISYAAGDPAAGRHADSLSDT